MDVESLIIKAAAAVGVRILEAKLIIKHGHKPLINFVPEKNVIIFVCSPELEYLLPKD